MNLFLSGELATLRRLRAGFLAGHAGAVDYWQSSDDLALYDATFAERIGWKCDAVLRELAARHWQPQSRHVLDFGCGSGIAGRRILAAWPGQFQSLDVYDRSALAAEFAAARARQTHPAIAVQTRDAVESLPADTLLVLSHVLNELSKSALDRLLALARQAREILWIEAGTHADSRRLITAVREPLLGSLFTVVAPCTHQTACGLLTEKNRPHWCHSFAKPPSSVFQDARWADFSRTLGIDLRALPYSFLVLERPRPGAPEPSGLSRVVGRPRDYKGYSKVLSCQEEGVCEFILQKRDAPELLRELRDGSDAPIYRWQTESTKIRSAQKPEPA